jgi:hypothetical protein
LVASGAFAHEGARTEKLVHPCQPTQAQRPECDVSQPTAPYIPEKRLSPLRTPRRSTVFWGPVRGNDPTDDGTSDDRDDDDDAWDDLSAAEESEASGTPWFEPTDHDLATPELEAEPRWDRPPPTISVLTLQKLRC